MVGEEEDWGEFFVEYGARNKDRPFILISPRGMASFCLVRRVGFFNFFQSFVSNWGFPFSFFPIFWLTLQMSFFAGHKMPLNSHIHVKNHMKKKLVQKIWFCFEKNHNLCIILAYTRWKQLQNLLFFKIVTFFSYHVQPKTRFPNDPADSCTTVHLK